MFSQVASTPLSHGAGAQRFSNITLINFVRFYSFGETWRFPSPSPRVTGLTAQMLMAAARGTVMSELELFVSGQHGSKYACVLATFPSKADKC